MLRFFKLESVSSSRVLTTLSSHKTDFSSSGVEDLLQAYDLLDMRLAPFKVQLCLNIQGFLLLVRQVKVRRVEAYLYFLHL